MRVGICDYPSRYEFPPRGYGGIERWLWAVAVGARQAGAEVHLLGPGWRHDIPDGFSRLPVRLEDLKIGEVLWQRLADLRLDLLVVGHEYPSLASWRRVQRSLGCRVVTFQHDPNFQHGSDAFDGVESTLFCYSPEMSLRYSAHFPKQDLSVQFGLDEEEPHTAVAGDGLVWIGRMDRQKEPHLAALAAARLRQPITFLGPVFDNDYMAEQADAFDNPYVTLAGEVAGADKLNLLAQASVMVYTCARDYVEAGAAVFGETMRCGTPVAGLVWRSGTCAEAALCEETGVISAMSEEVSDEEAAEELSTAIVHAQRLEALRVQEIGLRRFNPRRHFETLSRAR